MIRSYKPCVGIVATEIFLREDLESGLSKDGQMKRARFTEEQIIGVLKEHEAGAKTADLARKNGVSEATLYNWKADRKSTRLNSSHVALSRMPSSA